MTFALPHRALYAAFDRFPSAKGSATHIAQAATTLFGRYGGGALVVLGGDGLPLYGREESVEVCRYEEGEPNVIMRGLAFGRRLEAILDEQAASLELCVFRDPWGGVPILRRDAAYATIYEANGLPSIELPERYPHIARATVAKLRLAEEYCWTHASAIVTPSETIAANLVRLGAPAARINVVPNGADLPATTPAPPHDAPSSYLLYFGAVQRWQGVETLMRAFALLADLDLHLVICSSTHRRTTKLLAKLAERLGVADRVVWHYGLNREELGRWIAGAAMTVAPLAECARNLEQGCAPLKILESMAHAVPVIASDLPAVREIITDGVDGRLARPGRPSELARAVRLMLEYPELRSRLGEQARRTVEERFTWDRSDALLRRVYDSVAAPALPEVR